MKKIQSVNPATRKVIEEFQLMGKAEVLDIGAKANQAFKVWKNIGPAEKSGYFLKLAEVLREHKERYALHITREMGKPLTDSRAEVEKCAATAEVYAKKGVEWLQDEIAEADGVSHKVAFQPLGVILLVMPWNFPFWQALRCAIPVMLAGNGCILKHASNVSLCALDIEESFKLAGFPENLFRAVLADHQSIGELAESDNIAGISLTGSTAAGERIGALAGGNIKPVVLELGGSDPFIVLDDADVEVAARNAVLGRAQNCGQSCIAAKRFIVTERIADAFTARFAELLAAKKLGDPEDESTEIGPLVNNEALAEMEDFIKDAREKGGELVTGGKRRGDKGCFLSRRW